MTPAGRAAVVGSPIEHSLSPVLHRGAYASLGLDWEYERIEVPRGELAALVATLDDAWRGLSVTMPLKEEALALADVADAVARQTRAANTLVRSPTGQWQAHNTDVFGIIEAVREAAPHRMLDRALIIGSGATARSAVVAMPSLGVRSVVIAARNPGARDDVASLATSLGLVVARIDARPQVVDADLVVSTVPADAASAWSDVAGGFPDAVLLDVTYAPWPTTLARTWTGPIVSGLDLLVWQATEQVRLMTGRSVPVHVLRTSATGYPQT